MVWLINALLHSDERLRRRAGEELKHLTQEDVGYEPGKVEEAAGRGTEEVSDLVGRSRFPDVCGNTAGQLWSCAQPVIDSDRTA